jgi:hypothetical protein
MMNGPDQRISAFPSSSRDARPTFLARSPRTNDIAYSDSYSRWTAGATGSTSLAWSKELVAAQDLLGTQGDKVRVRFHVVPI